MAKLILSLENAPLGEFPLDKERMTIGRRPTNDIHIDNLAVSGEHAAIIQMGKDYFIEDLGSTNGTVVNTKIVKKHLLQHADVIELGKYQLKYINEALLNTLGTGGGEMDFEKTMIIRPTAKAAAPTAPVAPIAAAPVNPAIPVTVAPVPPVAAKPAPEPVVSVAASPSPSAVPPATPAKPASVAGGEVLGKIQVLNGSSSGRELVLNKALTTLGKPGVQVAVITKRPNGYFITHVEGQTYPVVNGASIGSQAHALKDHDVIELAGVKMEFYLS